MPTATQIIDRAHHKMLLWGVPKGGGKSTFAMYAPKPIALFQYDHGNPVIPPGVDGNDIYVKTYAPPDIKFNVNSSAWVRPKNVGTDIINDIEELRAAVLQQRPIKLASEAEAWPLPRTIVLDGIVAMGKAAIDWILAVNNIKEPENYNTGGKDSSQKFWGVRLDHMDKLLNAIIPLACNVILITWETPELDKEGRPTSKLRPDLGGKLNVWGPGKVDTSLYCFAQVDEQRHVHYCLRTRPTNFISEMGVRNLYGLPDVIDVTVTPMSYTPTPWERLWGKEAK